MLPDDSNYGELDEVLSYLLRMFGRVKGKDYVRKLMSRSKASLLVGTRRPGLTVTSLTARVKAEKEHRKDMVAAEEENNAMRAVIRELFEDEEDSA
jgi:hypothetical protein